MIVSGTVVDGRYEILQRVGSGGMADVYLAVDRLLGRRLAVKILHHRFAEDQEFVERFKREASSAAGLSHPNVVAIFDRGEWDGTYYIAMEYLPGRTLKQIVKEQGPLPEAAAIDIVLQVLRAVRFAHRRGVIHRDLKPHNVILDEEGRAKVTDFGIARAGASDMTLTGSIMGTAQYLSPEQAQGHAVSEASDLYAVGVVLYELLTGRVPFDGETAVTIALHHISSAPTPPSALNPQVRRELDEVVLTTLAKDPAARYDSAEALIGALEQVRAGLPAPVGGRAIEPVGVPAAIGLATDPEATATWPAPARLGGIHEGGNGAPTGSMLLASSREGDTSPDLHGGDPSRRSPRRHWLLWLFGLLVLLIVVGVAAVLLLAGPRSTTVPNVIRRTAAAARQQLQRAHLKAALSSAPSATVGRGLISSEQPAAGQRVERGSVVAIVLSTGPPSTTVPSVLGENASKAIGVLEAHHLTPKQRYEPSESTPEGDVIATDPAANASVQSGTAVSVLVSSGLPRVKVPHLTGQLLSSAKEAIAEAGLSVGQVSERVERSQPAGTVVSQSPAPSALARKGAPVALLVAKAPPSAQKVVVPNVLGEGKRAALRKLKAAGLEPSLPLIELPVSEPALAGTIIKQVPAAGRHVRRGTEITLYLGGSSLSSSSTSTSSATSSTTSSATSSSSSPPAPGG